MSQEGYITAKEADKRHGVSRTWLYYMGASSAIKFYQDNINGRTVCFYKEADILARKRKNGKTK